MYSDNTTNEFHIDLEDCEPQVLIPNSFSPNGDNLNERWFPEFWAASGIYTSIHWEIRNDDGIILYETNDLSDPGWDGTLSNGNRAPHGYYMYYINYATVTEENNIRTGHLELIR